MALLSYYHYTTLGTQLDPLMVFLNPLWIVFGPLFLLSLFLLVKREVGGFGLALIPVLYAPLVEGFITANSQLAFMPFFFLVYLNWKNENYNLAMIISALSCFARPDGVLLLFLSAVHAGRKGQLSFSSTTISGLIFLGYIITDSIMFTSPLNHFLINVNSDALDWSMIPQRIQDTPFTFFFTLLTLPLIIYAALSTTKFRPYFVFLLLFGLTKPYMLFEIGRWGGSTALLLFVLTKKDKLKKFVKPILIMEIFVATLFMNSVLKYMTTLV